ncbi:MAG: hypothetical protein C4519_18045 [Desulfobacteraceae bacterium]|nr:MAG: hypothetical protein C4519_18045 [Desulfobacteraceae bacterium]
MSDILKPGVILWSRYRILDLVGQGGMGAIYQAEDLRLEGRLCAIKEVIPNPGAGKEYQEQTQAAFHREASILARLDHANLPKVSQPGWDELPFHFWSPAFKARPQSFLKLAAHITGAQPQDALTPGPPTGKMRSVTLPVQEAVESLTLVLAFFARPRQRMDALLPAIHIQARRVLLVYLPFQEGHHEWVHPALNLAISKNLLAHARNL